MRFLVIFLIFLISIFNSYSDTNGIWINAEDIRGGILGDDENSDDFGVAGNLNISKDLYLEKLSSCYGSNQVLGLASNGSIVCVSNDDADNNNTNEIQILSIDSSSLNDEITISSGNTITIIDNINDSDNDPTNELPTSGNGIITGGRTVAIDPIYTQRRVVGTCNGYNQSIQIINQDGSVVCGNLDDYVSKTNGGTFSGLVDFTGGITINGNTLDSLYVEEGEVNSISTAMLQDDAVTSVKIADGTIETGNLKDGSVNSVKILDGSIQGIDVNKLEIQLRDNSETTCPSGYALTGINNNGGYICTTVDTDSFNELQNLTFSGGVLSLTDSLVEYNLSNFYVDEGQVNSISTAMLQDGSINSAKIFDGSINNVDLGSGSVNSVTILDGSIDTIDLKDGSVNSAKVLDNSLTGTDISDGSIQGVDVDKTQIQLSVVAACGAGNYVVNINDDGNLICLPADTDPTNEFQNLTFNGEILSLTDSLVGYNLSNYYVDEGQINSISTVMLQDGSVNSAKIFDGSINNVDLGGGSVNSVTILDGSIDTIDLKDGSVNSAKVLDNSLTGSDISDGSIQGIDVDLSEIQTKIVDDCSSVTGGSITKVQADGTVICLTSVPKSGGTFTGNVEVPKLIINNQDAGKESGNGYLDIKGLGNAQISFFSGGSGSNSAYLRVPSTNGDRLNLNGAGLYIQGNYPICLTEDCISAWSDLDSLYVPKTGGNFEGSIGVIKDVNEFSSFEIKGPKGAYIDFANDKTDDYDARLILWSASDDTLDLDGANFRLDSGKELCFGSNCRSNWDTVIQNVQCPSGQYLTGFDVSGNPLCDDATNVVANPTCGFAHNQNYYPGDFNGLNSDASLCSIGIPKNMVNASIPSNLKWTWDCEKVDGSTSVSCQANAKMDCQGSWLSDGVCDTNGAVCGFGNENENFIVSLDEANGGTCENRGQSRIGASCDIGACGEWGPSSYVNTGAPCDIFIMPTGTFEQFHTEGSLCNLDTSNDILYTQQGAVCGYDYELGGMSTYYEMRGSQSCLPPSENLYGGVYTNIDCINLGGTPETFDGKKLCKLNNKCPATWKSYAVETSTKSCPTYYWDIDYYYGAELLQCPSSYNIEVGPQSFTDLDDFAESIEITSYAGSCGNGGFGSGSYCTAPVTGAYCYGEDDPTDPGYLPEPDYCDRYPYDCLKYEDP